MGLPKCTIQQDLVLIIIAVRSRGRGLHGHPGVKNQGVLGRAVALKVEAILAASRQEGRSLDPATTRGTGGCAARSSCVPRYSPTTQSITCPA